MFLVCSCVFYISKSSLRYFCLFFSFLFLLLCLLHLSVSVEHSDHECRRLVLCVVLCIFALCVLRLCHWVHLGFYHYNRTFTNSFHFQAYLFDMLFFILSSFIWSVSLVGSIIWVFIQCCTVSIRESSLFTFTVITIFRRIFPIFCAVCLTFCFLSPFSLMSLSFPQFCLSPLPVWKYVLFCMFF